MRMKIVLITLMAAIGLSAGHAFAPAGKGPVAERTAPGSYQIDWGRDEAVDIYVADTANAPATSRRRLVDGDPDGKATVSVPADTRPYFYVVPEGGKGQWIAERVLPLEGGRNFRDLGGYRAADGRTVIWGRLFRSGSMAALTPKDVDYLGRLGIRTVCDLRTSQEREKEPNRWAQNAGLDYWTRDYEMSGGDLTRLFSGGANAVQAREAMTALYRELPYEQADAFRAMFGKLLAGETPLAFNCSAGKDRTGVAAALILTALGVPRDAVMADYELTNIYLPAALARDRTGASPLLASVPREVLGAVLAADPAYLNAAFDEMAKRNGSAEGYLRTVAGLSDENIARLRDMLLE